jgi:NTP pyrophosphatase (non-canonical NTP hydrolase)
MNKVNLDLEITHIPELNDLAATIRAVSASKGFAPPSTNNINEKLLLVISEICEAQNELRDGRELTEIYQVEGKPEGFPIEIADAIIRLLDITYSLNINISDAIELKIKYNNSRPHQHGRKF